MAYQILVRFDEEGIVIEDNIDKLKNRDANLDNGLRELVGDFVEEVEEDDYDEDFSQYIQSNGEYDYDED